MRWRLLADCIVSSSAAYVVHVCLGTGLDPDVAPCLPRRKPLREVGSTLGTLLLLHAAVCRVATKLTPCGELTADSITRAAAFAPVQGSLILKILQGRYPAVTGYSRELTDIVKACLTLVRCRSLGHDRVGRERRQPA